MSCNCERQLDSIMKFLEVMREEVRVVKTKCIRIEKEILGITAESEVKAEALMETTTVRHLLEKITFDVNVLTRESSNKAFDEATRLEKIEAVSKDLHSKFSEASSVKIQNLNSKYDAVALKSFKKEFSNILEEYRSDAEMELFQRGFSSSEIHNTVQKLVRTTDWEINKLYKKHFSATYEGVEMRIREQYSKVVKAYTSKADERMEDFLEIGLQVITEFLEKFRLCKEAFNCFKEELLKEFEQINKRIERNRKVLESLTQYYYNYFTRTQRGTKLEGELPPLWQKSKLEDIIRNEISMWDRRGCELYVQKLGNNMDEISCSSCIPWKLSYLSPRS